MQSRKDGRKGRRASSINPVLCGGPWTAISAATGFVNIAKLIYNLRQELELVNRAIRSLEPLVPRRRGRPRKRTSPDFQSLGVPDSFPGNSVSRPTGNRNIAASAEDLAREPGTESGRKGAHVD